PAVCWNTPCTPQKQPPASTAVWMPSAPMASTLGAGMITGSSAAREGAIATAAMASAPMAAQSERRLNWLRIMGSSWGGLECSLERGPRYAIGWRSSPILQDTRRRGICYDASPHEFVNKNH